MSDRIDPIGTIGTMFATIAETLASGCAWTGPLMGRDDDVVLVAFGPGAEDRGRCWGEALWTARGTSNQPKFATG